MIIGNKNTFAVESEFTDQDGWLVYGRFRVWVGGNAIGTYSEEVLNLKGTTGVLRNQINSAPQYAEHLSAAEFLVNVFEPCYGEGAYDHIKMQEWGCFNWLSYSESFETVFSAIAMVNNEIRIVWRLSDSSSAQEHYVSSAEYFDVCIKFIEWLDKGVAERRIDTPAVNV